MPTIIFFNNFHRGDLFTCREFIKQIKDELPQFTFKQMHSNHPKINQDLGIEWIGEPPRDLDFRQQCFVNEQAKTMFINSWAGCRMDIFTKFGGINMQTIYHIWTDVYNVINRFFGTNLKLRESLESYLPATDFSVYETAGVDEFVAKNPGKKILFCNGKPMSNQSFESDMGDHIKLLATLYPAHTFICTSKTFANNLPNVHFTDDITKVTGEHKVNVHWYDRPMNTCDLHEIAYLSRSCDLIVGKNSGPFVFCEGAENFNDPTKRLLSFGDGAMQSMSNGLDIKCHYKFANNFYDPSTRTILEDVILNNIISEIEKL